MRLQIEQMVQLQTVLPGCIDFAAETIGRQIDLIDLIDLMLIEPVVSVVVTVVTVFVVVAIVAGLVSSSLAVLL